MRGKAEAMVKAIESKGITPAYAGKRPSDYAVSPCCGDHPRLCGEKLLTYLPNKPYVGSPPPMRGKETIITREDEETGITPAYAGKRRLSTFLFPATGDHPRLCGEKHTNPLELLF